MQSQSALDELFEGDYQATIRETGYQKPLLVSDIPQIASTLKASVVLRVIPELDQFCDGLRECGVLESVKKYPNLMAGRFTATSKILVNKGAYKLCTFVHVLMFKNAIHLDYFRSLFSITFDTGPPRREKEREVYVFFMDFVEECGGMCMYMHDIVGHPLRAVLCSCLV